MVQLKIDNKIKQLETVVYDYITKEGGHVLAVTDDNIFLQVLRQTIQKHLSIPDDCLTNVLNEDHILKTIKDLAARKKQFVLFIERVFRDKEMSFLVKQVKEAYPNLKVVILTGEADRQRLVLLHEVGADNFVTKPISANTLIEKIAFTIRPQGKIGQLIESGKAMVAQGNYEAAIKTGRKILEMKPNSAGALLVMGDAYKALGKPEKAAEAYQNASEQAQMYLEPLKKLAELYQALGDKEKQLQYLEKLDRLSPLNVDRKVDMGGIHVELGQEDIAEELFRQAVEQAEAEARNYIGEVSAKIAGAYASKNPEKAEEYYRKALDAKGKRLDKSDILIFNRLGIALRRQGRWQDAVAEYQKALEVSPSEENLYYNMAMAYAEGKDYKSAMANMKSAVSINSAFFKQDPVVSYNIALVCNKAGETPLAKQFLQQALITDPGFTKAKNLLEALS